MFFFVFLLLQKISNPFLRNRILNMMEYNYLFLKKTDKFLHVFGYSLALQLVNCFSILLIIRFIAPNLNFSSIELFSVIPVGIFFQTLPISYSGLGVGHAAFERLLSIYGITTGADIFTIFFTLSFLKSLILRHCFTIFKPTIEFHKRPL